MASKKARRDWKWARRLLALSGAVVLLSGIVGAATFGRILFRPNAYEAVTSIETQPSFHDPVLLARAWALPVAEKYRQHPYEYQSNPSFCGPASVANLLRSLGVNFAQADVIRGTKFQPWFGILVNGLTLDELAGLIRMRLDRPVHIVRDLSLTAFREAMKSSNDPNTRLIVNFHRGPLFSRGAGHFSPILGYLSDRDLVFVGDVNGYYRPFLVETERLWQSTTTIDSTSGKARGLLIIDLIAPRP
ncbi:phytochelatin synthase family protein [Methylobacterium organophilum]|nr:phytochelatin synthase family protein [Methylobacterium organophilum]